MNDIFDCLPEYKKDRKIALIYQANIRNLVAVNTPVGQTERIDIPQIIQQGGGWGPLECSISIDKIGRKCRMAKDNMYRYRYKDKVDVLPLAMIDDLLAIAPCGLESLAMNSFITTNIEMKKLEFHTPGPDGKTKCHKIHVGRKNRFCPQLLIHGTEMPEVPRDTYLGDIVSGDGSNKHNIENRVAKGQGAIAQILSMVGKISLGRHYFKISLLLRETIFLSSVLTNSEVWYKLTDKDIDMLESLDRTLIKRIFSVPNSTPTSALYLESGCMTVGTIIKARRLNYLHYLVNTPEKEMLYRFFRCQWDNPNQNDWVNQVKKDLEDFKIPIDLKNINKTSRFGWKNLVKKKAKEFEFLKLIEMKESKNKTKMNELKYKKLERQEYLEELNVTEAKTVFRFRTKMENFEGNFKQKETKVSSKCPICQAHSDLQELCFECPVLKQKIGISEQYESIFGATITTNLARTLVKIVNIRKSLPERPNCAPFQMGAANIPM